MRFTPTLLALLAAPFAAFAQSGPNSFKIPDGGLSATGGQPLDLQWNPTTSGTVTLVLRSGSSNNLNEGTVIASNIDNSGSYTWTPSNGLTRGSDYTVEIVDDDDPSNVNYTPYFVLDTTTTAAQQTSIVSLGQPTTTPDLSTASPTGQATSLTEVLATSTDSAMSGASSMTNTASGMSTMTTGTSGGAMSSASSAASGMSSAMASASQGATSASQAAGSSSASASSSDLNSPQQSGNAGVKNSAAVVGMVGAVAMGVLAF